MPKVMTVMALTGVMVGGVSAAHRGGQSASRQRAVSGLSVEDNNPSGLSVNAPETGSSLAAIEADQAMNGLKVYLDKVKLNRAIHDYLSAIARANRANQNPAHKLAGSHSNSVPQVHATPQYYNGGLDYIAATAGLVPLDNPHGMITVHERIFLQCTINHESLNVGIYTAVDPSGVYRGAYQFDQSTWDSTAKRLGLTYLEGVPPNQAAPADQDWLGAKLYEDRGAQPWLGRCSNV